MCLNGNVNIFAEMNEWIYSNINDGVYRCGFAKSQEAYNEAVSLLYLHLEKVDQILSQSRYLVDMENISEADIRLFMTLVRFDEVSTLHLILK